MRLLDVILYCEPREMQEGKVWRAIRGVRTLLSSQQISRDSLPNGTATSTTTECAF